MTARPVLLGISSTMMSNCFYLATSYLIKNKNIHPGEITVFSAFIRIVIFGSWASKVKYQQMVHEGQQQEYSRNAWLCLVIGNLLIATTILFGYICLTLMPLSDYIVFAFTSPVSTLMFAMVKDR